jgi:hypothetical protein
MNGKMAILLSSACLGLVAVWGMLAMSQAANPTTASEDSWPSFEMTYEVRSRQLNPDRSDVGTQVTKLKYQDLRNWRSEILSHSGLPFVAGSWTELTDGVIRTYDASSDRTAARDEGDTVYRPDEWLSPGYIDRVIATGGLISETDSEGVFQVMLDDVQSCSEISQMHDCIDGLKRMKTTIRYQADSKIPISLVYELSDDVVREITVTSLELE